MLYIIIKTLTETLRKDSKMKTTYREIMKHNPCRELTEIPQEYKDNPDAEIDFKEILETSGVKDAFWCLRTQEYYDICLIIADVAESVANTAYADAAANAADAAYADAAANAANAAYAAQWKINKKILLKYI
jgi:hypothetical protein